MNSLSRPEDMGIVVGPVKRFLSFLAGRAETPMVNPHGLTVDAEGRLYVVDNFLKKVHVYDPKAKQYSLFPEQGAVLVSPIDIAIDNKRGRLYVSDSAEAVVRTYTRDGAKPAGEIRGGGMERPTGIAVNAATDELLVVDTANSAILRFSLDDHALKGIVGREGQESGRFHSPTHISVSPDGHIFVTDSLNFRVGVHDPAENFVLGGAQKHVECADCHNSHQSNSTPSSGAPFVSGATRGVSGIDATGGAVKVAQNQFEICFKCHGDNNFISSLAITRQIDQLNTRLEFDQANPSFHPVTGPGVNPNVPSLLPQYTTSSKILCTDCHNNNDAIGPKGPHGSSNPFLLAKNYTTADNTMESPVAYELCYSCHSRANILSDQSFKQHSRHIVNAKAPCSACHDAHGISNTQGNPVNNAHLINFDLAIVQPDSQGRLYYEKTGPSAGSCYLNCHGVSHAPSSY